MVAWRAWVTTDVMEGVSQMVMVEVVWVPSRGSGC